MSSQGKSMLERLPSELLHCIFELLPRTTLRLLTLVSHATYDYATDILWRDLNLVDNEEEHLIPIELRTAWINHSGHHILSDGPLFEKDVHDDGSIIKKLLLIAGNDRLAKKVRVVTHRCHLPTPAIFLELPHMSFSGQSLSSDWRTIALLRLAIQKMVNVHTLRIIFGHYNLTTTLLTYFFDAARPRNTSIRKLWLESCDIHADLLRELFVSPVSTGNPNRRGWMDASSLQSLRVRRLRLDPTTPHGDPEWHFALARGGSTLSLQNGRGTTYDTSVHHANQEHFYHPRPVPEKALQASLSPGSVYFDRIMYEELPAVLGYLEEHAGEVDELAYRPHRPPPDQLCFEQHRLLNRFMIGSSHSLTSINFDWLMLSSDGRFHDDFLLQYEFFESLANLRFPNLRAFQFRNAVGPSTKLPENIYLLHPTKLHFERHRSHGSEMTKVEKAYKIDFLSFMEAHPKIECLAWVMDRFYADVAPTSEYASRVFHLVSRLGESLVSLRVDSYYDQKGEPQSDTSNSLGARRARSRRRAFVSEFAPCMKKLKTLKCEGSIPKDEKREVVRAIHNCPLEKLVMIGLTCPLGNSWSTDGEEISDMAEADLDLPPLLESEHEQEIMESQYLPLNVSGPNFKFIPKFGWPPSPPLLYSIASFHASTITELKFCGYNGSPVINRPANATQGITRGLLAHLVHFHNLRNLVLSCWLLKPLGPDLEVMDIIYHWLEERERVEAENEAKLRPNPRPDDHLSDIPHLVEQGERDDDWAYLDISRSQLGNVQEEQDGYVSRFDNSFKSRFSPLALARSIDNLIGCHLSPFAKSRTSGVDVRASFSLGIGDIFDLDVWIGENGMIDFAGPRAEVDKDRWWGKLDARAWF